MLPEASSVLEVDRSDSAWALRILETVEVLESERKMIEMGNGSKGQMISI